MLFTAVPSALIATEPWLEADLYRTLVCSAVVSNVAQILRAAWSRGSDAYSASLMGILSVLSTPLVALVMVAYGAPVISAQKETILSALVSSSLILQPSLTLYGLDADCWRQIIGLSLPSTDVYLGSLGGVVGAWFGVVPIALDWDRSWQRYPITIVLGAYVGSVLGLLLGSFFPRAGVVDGNTKKKSKSKRTEKAN